MSVVMVTGGYQHGLNRMHVMEGESEKCSEMVAESAPELVTSKTTILELKLGKEDLPSAEPGVPEPPTELLTSVEPLVNGTNGNLEEEKSDSCDKDKPAEPVVSVNGDSEENSASVECRTKEDSAKEEKDDAKEIKEVKEAKEKKEVKEVELKESSGGCSEEEDRQSVTSSQSRKRAALTEVEGEGENSSSESDGGSKRQRLEPDDGEDERERLVREYVEECTESVDEMNRAADKLQREIGALGELLRAKELEWNSILRLRKLKEEMLERLLRRRRLASVLSENGIREEQPPNNVSNKPKVININNTHQPPSSSGNTNNGSLMMVPIVSSGPGPYGRGPPRLPEPRSMAPRPQQRPILPKPGPQEPIVGEGRQGPILDVKSIIADYRSRHPENVPRRGRRMRGPEGGSGPPPAVNTRISGSPALMSMANMALGSGSHVRENPPFMGQDSSRPSSADSSRGSHHLDMLSGPGSGGLSFKDALVQFAKMSQPNKPPPPPPPYPEVTLHPVSAPHSPPAPPPHSSLLHGILTKSNPGPRATTFSPTLARLLTAPERNPTSAPLPPTPTFRPPHHHVPPHQRGVNISEILSSSKKNRNEITITPVSGSNKTKDDVVMLQDEDEEGDGDRLIIDEGRDSGSAAGPGGELPENVPQCQGCHQRAAQFVCAGCGNQWYCSRDCQVNAWEEHSEMCSG
ncbi:misshapen-like kinase 1 isoform X2 [Macrosteles quadrilineatus]|uniref:misshapen-like kinase 1 isoform X2 n=1 Tax=Macrosteles quadrilineatus TaxID=74068 RepID=UPI0023E2086B|nr:misshapen-like kinase 1 isoform X2 [Macrosteles quadrilineatus]